MKISSREYKLVIQREVVRVEPEMLAEDYSMEFWMETKGFRCRLHSPGYSLTSSEYVGVYFTPFSDPDAEPLYAYIGDYIVFNGFGKAEVMDNAEFEKVQPQLVDCK